MISVVLSFFRGGEQLVAHEKCLLDLFAGSREGELLHDTSALAELIGTNNDVAGLAIAFLDLVGPVLISLLVSKVDVEASNDSFIGHDWFQGSFGLGASGFRYDNKNKESLIS